MDALKMPFATNTIDASSPSLDDDQIIRLLGYGSEVSYNSYIMTDLYLGI